MITEVDILSSEVFDYVISEDDMADDKLIEKTYDYIYKIVRKSRAEYSLEGELEPVYIPDETFEKKLESFHKGVN